MSWGVTSFSHSYSVCPPPCTPPRRHQRSCSVPQRASRGRSPLSSSTHRLFLSGSEKFPRINLRCNSVGGSGDNESKTILDAFFLGKAAAEALSERIESAVGEFLSAVVQLQSEQQKQVQEFQEEVLEKARRAKEQAVREAMVTQGLASNSTAPDITRFSGFTSTTSSASGSVTSSSVSKQINEDPLSAMLNAD